MVCYCNIQGTFSNQTFLEKAPSGLCDQSFIIHVKVKQTLWSSHFNYLLWKEDVLLMKISQTISKEPLDQTDASLYSF